MTLEELFNNVGMLPALGNDLASQILHQLLSDPEGAQVRLTNALLRAAHVCDTDECCF